MHIRTPGAGKRSDFDSVSGTFANAVVGETISNTIRLQFQTASVAGRGRAVLEWCTISGEWVGQRVREEREDSLRMRRGKVETEGLQRKCKCK